MFNVRPAAEAAPVLASEAITDAGVAEFIGRAESAHVYFDLISDRLTVRAVNPIWEIWQPLRHRLYEIGTQRIEAYLRRATVN